MLGSTALGCERLLTAKVNHVDVGAVDRSNISRPGADADGYSTEDARDLHAEMSKSRLSNARATFVCVPIARLHRIDEIVVRDYGDGHGRLTGRHFLCGRKWRGAEGC